MHYSLRALLTPSVRYWLGLLLIASSCKKEETPLEQLPGATQEGQQTAGWLLDERAWVPKRSSISTGSPVDGYWQKTKTGHSLGLSFRHFAMKEVWGVTFFVSDIRQAGTFPLNQDPAILTGRKKTAYGQCYYENPSPKRSYYTGPDAPGQLIITRFDTINNIVSGTFEMTPREEDGGATIEVTHGRFDLHFER